MTKFVIDAFAWLEYLSGSERGSAVVKILEDDSNEIFTCAATFAEVVSKFLRSSKDAGLPIAAMNNLSSVVNLTPEIGLAAAQIHFIAKKKNRDFGMLDAFVAATAKKFGAKILTGDDDFKSFKEAVLI